MALFPVQVLLKGVKWSLAGYFKEASFTYEQLAWKEGKIRIYGGKIYKPGYFTATFSKAAFQLSVHLKQQEIGGHLTVEGLKMVSQKKWNPKPFSLPSLPFLSLNLTAEFLRGELFLCDSFETNPFSHHVFLDLSCHLVEDKCFGSISLDWKTEIPALQAHFWQAEDECFQLVSRFDLYPAHSLLNMVIYLFREQLPEPVRDWRLEQGMLNGKLGMSLVDGRPLKMKGKLQWTEVKGENHKLALLGQLDTLQGDFDIDFCAMKKFNGDFALHGCRLALSANDKKMYSIDCNRFMGVEGAITLDGRASSALMRIQLYGSSNEIKFFLPQALQKGFEKAFSDDRFRLAAALKKSSYGLELEGELVISEGEKTYDLAFGCLFGNSQEKTLEKMTPFSFSVEPFFDYLSHQLCISQKPLGWFRGKHLPIEKFLSPFLLQQVRMDAFGEMNVEGTFDKRYVVICYEGEDFRLESPSFSLTADQINETLTPERIAVHYLDLKTKENVGFLPLKSAAYWQKNYDIHFPKVDTLIHFKNGVIQFKEITTKWKSLSFLGEIQVEIRALDDVDLTIRAERVTGSASDAQALLRYFTHSFFLDIPLEGEVKGDSEPLFFKYHFTPRPKLLEGLVRGIIKADITYPLLTIKDYEAAVEYCFSENRLYLQKGTGKFHFFEQEKMYIINTESIKFTDFPFFQVVFNLDLSDEAHCLWTLQGKTQKKSDTRHIFLNASGPHPFKTFQLEAIQDSGFLTLPHFTLGKWEGEASLNFSKERLKIEHFSTQAFGYAALAFSGIYDLQNHKLSGEIQQVRWDLASLSQNLQREKENTPFAALAPWKPKGEIFGSGRVEWEKGKGGLRAQLAASFQDLEVGGVHFGSGEDLKCSYSSEKGLSIEGLEVEIPREEKGEKYKLGCFHYNFNDQKIFLEEFDFSLPPSKLPWVAEMTSSFFSEKGSKLVDWIKVFKPTESCEGKPCEGKPCESESLEGQLSLEIYPDNIWVYLSLKDGNYYLFDRKFYLKNFSMIYDPLELNIWTQCRYDESYYWFHFLTDNLTMSHGTLALSEYELSSHAQEKDGNAITATWERQSGGEWSIHQIQGNFCGLKTVLEAPEELNFSNPIKLKGEISFNPRKLIPLLSDEWRDNLRPLSLAGSCVLGGEFTMDKNDFSDITFDGTVLAHNFEVGRVKLSDLSSELICRENDFVLSSIEVKDRAGRLNIDRLSIQRFDEEWQVYMNQLNLEEVRLSRLRSPWTQWGPRDKHFFRSLFIRSFKLDNVAGSLSKPESLIGSGKLKFNNLPKRTLFSNLLFLPSEITARIGLDLTSLIPARGTVLYEIKGGKIFLNEFKDMYSDGKHSRFYLAGEKPAYIDFKGNLSMKMKMKQYNLLLKLAEFFTISVEGTLLHPTYTFSNQFED